MRHAFIAVCAVLLASAPAEAAPDHRAVVLAAVDGWIVPGYVRFAERAAALEGAAGAFCARPDRNGLDAVRTEFNGTMDAWQRVQLVAFGPVESFNRGQRVQFWPDKKNAGDRQLRQLLKERNAGALEPTRMVVTSVAVQGLPALETLLYGSGEPERLLSGDDAAFRCRVVTAIAANVARIGGELATEWSRPGGYRTKMETAGEGGSPYTDHQHAASQIFNAMHGHLEAIAEVKLAYPMGEAPASARPQRAESWRAQRSLRNIVLNLEALRALSETAFVPGLAAAPGAGRRLTAAIDTALAVAARLDGPMETALETPRGWQWAGELKAGVKGIGRVLETDVGPALGLQVGFNALDGD